MKGKVSRWKDFIDTDCTFPFLFAATTIKENPEFVAREIKYSNYAV
jgi:hypothetical protein